MNTGTDNQPFSGEQKEKGVRNFRTFTGRCSKTLNTSCLPKRPRPTAQTQNRLFLMKQSDQGLHCFSDKHFVNPNPVKANMLFENGNRKVFKILEQLHPLIWRFAAYFTDGKALPNIYDKRYD